MAYALENYLRRKKLAEQIAPIVKKEKELDGKVATDIAPVGNQEEKSSWFSSATFNDGYQVGDVTKALLGTTVDLSVGMAKGVGRMVEGLVDLGTYAVGGIGGLFGADEFNEGAKKVAQYSAVDEWSKPADEALAPYSVLGKKSDSIAEGLGQVGAMILTGGALGAVGASSAVASGVTMGGIGLSSMGSGMNEAYSEGANDQEAVTYGLIAGGAEALSEMIFGGLSKASKILGVGRGVSSLDDTVAKGLASKFKSTFAKNLTEWIVKSGAEGAEEVISGSIQALGKALTYKQAEKPEEWASNLWSLVEDENLMESFIIGAITSGISQSGGAIKSTVQGTDYVTGYTQNEQKVIDAEVAKRVADKEKSGKKLSKAEIGDIQKSVESDMERGYISIDTIENTLGSEKYNSIINKTPDEIAKLRNRKSTLETEIKNAVFTKNPDAKKSSGGNKALELLDQVSSRYYQERGLAPTDRASLDPAMKELKSVTEALRQYDNIDNVKKARGSEVFELLSKERNGQGSLLLSSYAEKAKTREAFKVDLDKVAPGKQATYKRAMESGAWNNANRTHEFVDFVANIENKTGIKFDFANNNKLAESGYSVEGAVINGVATKDGIILNANSQKSLDVVVGHEIAHTAEQAKNYAELREHILQYAQAKGDYQTKRDAIEKLYAQKNADGSILKDENGNAVWVNKDVDIDGEVVADLVGEYLFTDENYIKKLVTRRNLAQKIFDEVKHLVKLATAGSREEKELLRVQKSFEKAFNEIAESKHVFTSDSIKYNLSAVTEHKEKLNTEYSVAESTVELGELQERYDKIIKIWEELGGEIDSEFLDKWNNKTDTEREFSVFKKQDGYKYNLELSTMCKKGVPLFEAIDQIVSKEVMSQLKTDTIGKEEKQILYDILKNHSLDIPCAICYVEQARQREGIIIKKFLEGDGKDRIGWNQALTMLEEKMAEKGVNYKFPKVDRSIDTDNYKPADLTMDKKTEGAFYEALKDLVNEEITKYNAGKEKSKRRPLVKEATPESIKKSLGGTLTSNLFVYETLCTQPDSRFAIDGDLLYSSMTTSNLSYRHNRLYSLFNSQGGVGGYKTKQRPIIYWADLLGTKWNPAKLRNASGMRNQSNSDFQMYTLLDQAQMYIDMTAKGYYLHAYTKVPAELKLFGLSNGKINASLIPAVKTIYNEDGTVNVEQTMENAGLDADGELIFDDVEGINHEEAFMLIRDKNYSKNVGGICIGYSDNHIAKLLDTTEVQLIIGFHDKTNNPKKRYVGAKYAKNYRGFNETKRISDGKTMHKPFGEYLKKAESHFKKSGEDFSGEYAFNGKTYSANDIPKLASELYLEDCRKNGWSPMYSIGGMNFSTHENYYKLLADFSLYDSEGNYAPHKKVSYNMPDQVPYLDENGEVKYEDTKEFIKKGLESEMDIRDAVAEKLADKSEDGIIPQFIKRVNELHEGVQYSLGEKSNVENLANIDFYGEKEYNSYGWARVNGVLSSKENTDFRSKFASVVLGKGRPDTSNGEYIIACGEDGVNNKLVYAKGNKNDLQALTITKVVEIKLDNETDIENVRSDIYEWEKNFNTRASEIISRVYGDEFVREHILQNYRNYGELQNERRNSQRVEGTNQRKNGRRTSYIFEEEVSDDDVKSSYSLSNELTTENSAPQGKYTGMAYEGEPVSPTSSTELSTETPTEDIAPTVDNSVETVDTPERIKLSEIKPDLKEIAPETPKATEIKPTTDEIAPQKSKIKVDDSKMRIGVKDTTEKNDTIIEKPSPGGHTQVVQTKPLDAPLTMDSVKSDYAKVSATDPAPKKNPQKGWFRTHFVDKGAIFEDLDIERKRKDRPLQSKFHKIARAEAMAQNLIGNGAEGVKSLQSIKDRAEAHKTSHEFQDYLYHLHNIDRMSLDTRFKTANKAVFGDDVTADVSRQVVAEYEAKYSWFKKDAEAVYNYNRHLRQLMVDKGLISAETAELWEQMYPHYVPITRTDHDGVNVNVPLYTNKTGVNAPVKRAVGGNGDINNLFNTMAERTEQVYRAIAKNEFGIELKNTLNSEIAEDTDTLDIDNIDNDELLQPSKNGKNPTFTVFENGKRVTFEITPEMYEAMRPSILPDSENIIAKTVRGVSKARRNLITQYNPFFAVRNAIKDAQDVWWNSQHAMKTYAKFPTAVKEMLTKGRYYTEYLQNGGEAQKHYDNNKRSFDTETKLQKMSGVAFGWISKMSDFSEKIPRLAEYIASRENGASVDTAMLDSARVTTNFQAGGDITKWANRHGFTFLNAGVQGFLQNVRNVREAKMNGLKGGLALMGKLAVAGIPMILANAILWGDDEEYEELSDYVKDNYYIIGKFNDGTFVRLPKGRTTAVVQDAFEQVGNTITGDDEADWENFWKLFIDNLAPSNPLDNNLFAPIADVIDNETWYGEDLVPTRLQDLPKSEQYDESTDALSRWLGENIPIFSPYQYNYLIDQYSGVLGDIALPMMTPESTSGAENPLEHLGAMATDNFTTDSTFNNQNVTDFYDVLDELTANANSANATEEDKLKYKYMSSIRTELSDLYKLKREIQGSDLGNKEKYDQVSAIQDQINALAKNGLDNYNTILGGNGFAQIGDSYFYHDGESWKTSKKDTVIARNVFGDSKTYMEHSSYLNSIQGDIKTRKAIATKYFNSIDLEFGQKIILYRQLFPNDDKYNRKIVTYLNGRKDLTKAEKIEILENLGMNVDKNGKVTWN